MNPHQDEFGNAMTNDMAENPPLPLETTPTLFGTNQPNYQLVPVWDGEEQILKLVEASATATASSTTTSTTASCTSPSNGSSSSSPLTTMTQPSIPKPPSGRGRKRRKRNDADSPTQTTIPNVHHKPAFSVISSNDVVLADNQARDDTRTTAATRLLRQVKRQHQLAAKKQQSQGSKANWIPRAVAEFEQQWPGGRVLLRCKKRVLQAQRVPTADQNQFGFAQDAAPHYGLAASARDELIKFMTKKDAPQLAQEVAWYRDYVNQQQAQQVNKWQPVVNQLLLQFSQRLQFFEELLRLEQQEQDQDAKLFLKELGPINPLRNLWERLEERLEKARKESPAQDMSLNNPFPPPPNPPYVDVSNGKYAGEMSSVTANGPLVAFGTLQCEQFQQAHGSAPSSVDSPEKVFPTEKAKGSERPLQQESQKTFDEDLLSQLDKKLEPQTKDTMDAKQLWEDPKVDTWFNPSQYRSLLSTASLASIEPSDAALSEVRIVIESNFDEDIRSLKMELDAASMESSSLLCELRSLASSPVTLPLNYDLALHNDSGSELRLGGLAGDAAEESVHESFRSDASTTDSKAFPGSKQIVEDQAVPVDVAAGESEETSKEPTSSASPVETFEDPPGFFPGEGFRYQEFLKSSRCSLSEFSYLESSIKSRISRQNCGPEPPEERQRHASEFLGTSEVQASLSDHVIESFEEDAITSITAHVASAPRVSYGSRHIESHDMGDLPSTIDYKDQCLSIHEIMERSTGIEKAIPLPPPTVVERSIPVNNQPTATAVVQTRRYRRISLLMCFWRRPRRPDNDEHQPNHVSTSTTPRSLVRAPSSRVVEAQLIQENRNQEAQATQRSITPENPVMVSSYALSDRAAVAPSTRSSRLSALVESESDINARDSRQNAPVDPAHTIPCSASTAIETGTCQSLIANQSGQAMEITARRPVSSSAPVGLCFDTTGQPDQRLRVAEIKEDSIFANSDMRVGMLVVRMNGFEDLSVQEANEFVDRMKGPITIVVNRAESSVEGDVGQLSERANQSELSGTTEQRIFARPAFISLLTKTCRCHFASLHQTFVVRVLWNTRHFLSYNLLAFLSSPLSL